jgi:LmbE family N-acetylglucosaminyl deacetylase
MRILAIHSHPDDIEILAGGTMALLARRGHQIVFVTMTPGDCGSSEHSSDEIAAIRRGEAAASAKIIGAEYLCGEFRDLSIFSDNESRRRVAAILRKARPDIVITSSPVDYLCDHEATSMLVRDACFGTPAPNYAPSADPVLPGIPHLYFMDPIDGQDREGGDVIPQFVVNVGETFAVKKAMLACHDSQRLWLKTHHGIDNYLDSMEVWTRKRGQSGGFEFGEGFRRYLGHPYPQTPVLEDLLRAYCL